MAQAYILGEDARTTKHHHHRSHSRHRRSRGRDQGISFARGHPSPRQPASPGFSFENDEKGCRASLHRVWLRLLHENPPRFKIVAFGGFGTGLLLLGLPLPEARKEPAGRDDGRLDPDPLGRSERGDAKRGAGWSDEVRKRARTDR